MENNVDVVAGAIADCWEAFAQARDVKDAAYKAADIAHDIAYTLARNQRMETIKAYVEGLELWEN